MGCSGKLLLRVVGKHTRGWFVIFQWCLKKQKRKITMYPLVCFQPTGTHRVVSISGHFKIFFLNADSRGSTSHHPREEILEFVESY